MEETSKNKKNTNIEVLGEKPKKKNRSGSYSRNKGN